MTRFRSRAFVGISFVLGFLLLVAASLKIYGWSVSTVPSVGPFSTPSVQGVAVGWEILLSLWLLSGVAPAGSWLAAIGTFVLLAGISGYLGWIGQATCDCFGAIQASPWLAFAVDLAALLMLLSIGPSLFETTRHQGERTLRETRLLVRFVLGTGVMLAVLIGIGGWIYGSPAKAWARLRDEPLGTAPEYVDCGEGNPGEKLQATVRVYNWTDEPVLIYGGTSDCTCVTTAGLPISIPPGESQEVPLRLRVPHSKSGAYTRQVDLITNCKQKRTIKLRIGCSVK